MGLGREVISEDQEEKKFSQARRPSSLFPSATISDPILVACLVLCYCPHSTPFAVIGPLFSVHFSHDVISFSVSVPVFCSFCAASRRLTTTASVATAVEHFDAMEQRLVTSLKIAPHDSQPVPSPHSLSLTVCHQYMP